VILDRGGDPGALEAVRDGRAGVQDEGSQLVAVALAEAQLAGPDERWLELCAGPGGKAALLGALAAGRGARLVAVEAAAHRARLLRRAVAGLPVRVVRGDAREPPGGGFDRVLLDAPCSGLGALRRRPEARCRRTPADVEVLAAGQRELLAAAIRAARPGGLVGYVTCSPHPAETTAVVDEAVRTGLVELADDPLAAAIPESRAFGGPHTQLWPHRHGTDAMFLALLRRLPD